MPYVQRSSRGACMSLLRGGYIRGSKDREVLWRREARGTSACWLDPGDGCVQLGPFNSALSIRTAVVPP